MSTLNSNPKSLQWMIAAGVNGSDVAWLESMQGSTELHLAPASQRVEAIYTAALDGLLSSESFETILRMSLH